MSKTTEKPRQRRQGKKRKRDIPCEKKSSDAVSNNSPERKIKYRDAASQKYESSTKYNTVSMEEMKEQYPVLADEALIKQFLAVPLTNNQKGRIRQTIREDLKTASGEIDASEVNRRISAILTANESLNDAHLRKIRILHNMLKTSIVDKAKVKTNISSVAPKTVETKPDKEEEVEVEIKHSNKKEKVNKNKRYVVFVGNLPYDVEKEQIKTHFARVADSIKDVRIPKPEKEKKGGIAYVELNDEKSYQIALCHHHSMFGSRRINVLYTTADNTKMDKKAMKGKVAKMQALHKSGKLIGSASAKKKRSVRRKRQREALAKEKLLSDQNNPD